MRLATKVYEEAAKANQASSETSTATEDNNKDKKDRQNLNRYP